MGSLQNSMRQVLAGLDSLFYPKLCLGCDKPLSGSLPATYLCLSCHTNLPFTNYHKLAENRMTDRLAGRIPAQFAAAFLHYTPGGSVQQMVHALKYYNRPDIATDLGALYGQELLEVSILQDLDAIVPVPLHPKRQHERGYNQAAAFGLGLANALQKPLWTKVLKRQVFEASQTQKGLQERIENVAQTFTLGRQNLDQLHLLLVDDVLTTGATLEACSDTILAAFPQARISIATIAITD